MQALNLHGNANVVDVTFGGGGHSKAILKQLDKGKLWAFDQDADAGANVIVDNRFVLIPHNFKNLKQYLQLYGALPVDGVLADLGVSSHQFDTAHRGFSTRFDGGLDMRMNQQNKVTAAHLLATLSQDELQQMFSVNAEIRNAKTLAACIVNHRIKQTIKTSAELKVAIVALVPAANMQQYLAQVFQALRIEVNQELDALKQMLQQSAQVLKPGGRLVVMSYHSLEDRLVKNFINSGNFEGKIVKDLYGNAPETPFKSLNKKPITASETEVKNNPRARSAKLRIAEKT